MTFEVLVSIIDATEIRKGMKILWEGQPCLVTEAQFVKPGKGTAFTRARIRNMMNGRSLEQTYKASERIELCSLDERGMEFLYQSTGEWHFMDNSNFEQLVMSTDAVGEAGNWLTENLPVKILFFNDKPISIDLPNFVELQITECEPAVKGDTKANAQKLATMQTGATVGVPMFVDNGEWIRIDTRTGEYVERVKR